MRGGLHVHDDVIQGQGVQVFSLARNIAVLVKPINVFLGHAVERNELPSELAPTAQARPVGILGPGLVNIFPWPAGQK